MSFSFMLYYNSIPLLFSCFLFAVLSSRCQASTGDGSTIVCGTAKTGTQTQYYIQSSFSGTGSNGTSAKPYKSFVDALKSINGTFTEGNCITIARNISFIILPSTSGVQYTFPSATISCTSSNYALSIAYNDTSTVIASNIATCNQIPDVLFTAGKTLNTINCQLSIKNVNIVKTLANVDAGNTLSVTNGSILWKSSCFKHSYDTTTSIDEQYLDMSAVLSATVFNAEISNLLVSTDFATPLFSITGTTSPSTQNIKLTSITIIETGTMSTSQTEISANADILVSASSFTSFILQDLTFNYGTRQGSRGPVVGLTLSGPSTIQNIYMANSTLQNMGQVITVLNNRAFTITNITISNTTFKGHKGSFISVGSTNSSKTVTIDKFVIDSSEFRNGKTATLSTTLEKYPCGLTLTNIAIQNTMLPTVSLTQFYATWPRLLSIKNATVSNSTLSPINGFIDINQAGYTEADRGITHTIKNLKFISSNFSNGIIIQVTPMNMVWESTLPVATEGKLLVQELTTIDVRFTQGSIVLLNGPYSLYATDWVITRSTFNIFPLITQLEIGIVVLRGAIVTNTVFINSGVLTTSGKQMSIDPTESDSEIYLSTLNGRTYLVPLYKVVLITGNTFTNITVQKATMLFTTHMPSVMISGNTFTQVTLDTLSQILSISESVEITSSYSIVRNATWEDKVFYSDSTTLTLLDNWYDITQQNSMGFYTLVISGNTFTNMTNTGYGLATIEYFGDNDSKGIIVSNNIFTNLTMLKTKASGLFEIRSSCCFTLLNSNEWSDITSDMPLLKFTNTEFQPYKTKKLISTSNRFSGSYNPPILTASTDNTQVIIDGDVLAVQNIYKPLYSFQLGLPTTNPTPLLIKNITIQDVIVAFKSDSYPYLFKITQNMSPTALKGTQTTVVPADQTVLMQHLTFKNISFSILNSKYPGRSGLVTFVGQAIIFRYLIVKDINQTVVESDSLFDLAALKTVEVARSSFTNIMKGTYPIILTMSSVLALRNNIVSYLNCSDSMSSQASFISVQPTGTSESINYTTTESMQSHVTIDNMTISEVFIGTGTFIKIGSSTFITTWSQLVFKNSTISDSIFTTLIDLQNATKYNVNFRGNSFVFNRTMQTSAELIQQDQRWALNLTSFGSTEGSTVDLIANSLSVKSAFHVNFGFVKLMNCSTCVTTIAGMTIEGASVAEGRRMLATEDNNHRIALVFMLNGSSLTISDLTTIGKLYSVGTFLFTAVVGTVSFQNVRMSEWQITTSLFCIAGDVDVTMKDSSFTDIVNINTTDANGVVLYFDFNALANLVVTNTVFFKLSTGRGGALYSTAAAGTHKFTGCTFRQNMATMGAVFFIFQSLLFITDSIFIFASMEQYQISFFVAWPLEETKTNLFNGTNTMKLLVDGTLQSLADNEGYVTQLPSSISIEFTTANLESIGLTESIDSDGTVSLIGSDERSLSALTFKPVFYPQAASTYIRGILRIGLGDLQLSYNVDNCISSDCTIKDGIYRENTEFAGFYEMITVGYIMNSNIIPETTSYISTYFYMVRRKCVIGELNYTFMGNLTEACVMCPASTYSFDTSAPACKNCPTDQAICKGGALLKVLAGFSRPSLYSDSISTCLVAEACLDENTVGLPNCATGYTGINCYECDGSKNYCKAYNNRCELCSEFYEDMTMAIFLTLASLIMQGLLLAFLYRAPTEAQFTVALCLSLFQKISIISIHDTYFGKVFPVMSFIGDPYRFISMRLQCIATTQDITLVSIDYLEQLFILSWPAFKIIVCVIMALFSKRRLSVKKMVGCCLMSIVMMDHMGFLQVILPVFDCINLEDAEYATATYMRLKPHIKCHNHDHITLTVVGALTFAIWIFGVTAVLQFRRSRKLIGQKSVFKLKAKQNFIGLFVVDKVLYVCLSLLSNESSITRMRGTLAYSGVLYMVLVLGFTTSPLLKHKMFILTTRIYLLTILNHLAINVIDNQTDSEQGVFGILFKSFTYVVSLWMIFTEVSSSVQQKLDTSSSKKSKVRP